MSIYVGNGSQAKPCLPVESWHNVPYVHPIVVGTGLARYPVFPLWGDAICTYGFNLPTLTYKGKMDDWSPIPYNDGRTIGATVTGFTSTSNGMSVSIDSTNGYAYLYPSHESVESAKQKLRGSNYALYDDYLGVKACTMEPSGETTNWSSKSSKTTYAYHIDLNASSNTTLKLLDGWFLYKKTGTRAFDTFYLDLVWNPIGSNPTPMFVKNSDGVMQLSSDVATHAQTYEFVTGTDFTWAYIVCNGVIYVLCHLAPRTLNGGNLLVYPRMRFSTDSSASSTLTLVQYGLTFGV